MEYDCVGGVTDADVDELMELVAALAAEVRAWLNAEHPDLVPYEL